MTSADLKARFADYLRDELQRAPGTVREYLLRLSYVEQALEKPVQAITAAELRAYKTQMLRSYSSGTVKGIIVAVRQFFSWGTLEGLSLDPAVALVRTPKEVNDSCPPLPIEKARALLEACVRPLDYKLVYYGLYAGTRIGETARMTAGHWQDGYLRFRGGKTGRLREIPIHPELARVERTVAASKRSWSGVLQNRKRALEERVGFPFVTHQLRKTFSTCLHDAGVSDLCRRDLLGHALGLDGVYTLISRKEKAGAILALDYADGHRTICKDCEREGRRAIQQRSAAGDPGPGRPAR